MVLAITVADCGGGSDPDGLLHAAPCTQSFSSCGGDPTGNWRVVGVCFETDPVAALNQGLVPACANQFNAAELAIRGTVAYQAGSVTYDFNGEASSSYSYTATCAASLFDYSSMDSATCTEIQTANRRYGNPETETNCSYSNSTCNCSSMRIQKTQSTNTYVLLTEGAVQESDGSDYEICVTGNRMSQREMAFGNAYSITQLQKL